MENLNVMCPSRGFNMALPFTVRKIQIKKKNSNFVPYHTQMHRKNPKVYL